MVYEKSKTKRERVVTVDDASAKKPKYVFLLFVLSYLTFLRVPKLSAGDVKEQEESNVNSDRTIDDGGQGTNIEDANTDEDIAGNVG